MADVVTTAGARRVEVHGRIIRADGRVEELGLLAGREADGTPMTPDPRPTGVEYQAAIAWVWDRLMDTWTDADPERVDSVARAIVDDLFRYGPIVPDGTPGARTHLTTQEGT